MEEIKEGYTRVSEIVGWFKANELAKIDPDTLRKKCDIGTNVHAAIEAYDEGIYVPLDEKEKGYFESFKKWKASRPYVIQHEEQRLYCEKLKITGKLDCVAIDMETGQAFIIDFKTSASEDRVGWPMQGGWYHHLITVNKMTVEPKVCFVKLDKNGEEPEIFWYPITSKLYINMMKGFDIYNIWHAKKKDLPALLY